ncbi:MAG: phosphotransferase [Cytophagales bacterium]|nr:phosphotransferase [Cytophagales bacterium]
MKNTPATLALPVTYSLVSPLALRQELLPLYGLTEAATVSLLAQGMHDTYLVAEPAPKYVLRIYRAGWKTFAQVEAEVRVLRLLQAQGLPVGYPIADAQGTSIHRLASPEGERYAVLFAYAAGEKVNVLTPTQASRFGQYVGQMHAITAGRQDGSLHRDYSPERIFEETRRGIRAVLPTHREAHRQLERICECVGGPLSPDVLKTLKAGICHGDPHHENLFIEPATGEVTMFDFDFSGNGYLLYDLGSFCFYERQRQPNVEAFLDGYARVLPLTPAERQRVPCFTILMRLFHLGARSQNADGIKNPLWPPAEIAAKIDDIEKEACRLNS